MLQENRLLPSPFIFTLILSAFILSSPAFSQESESSESTVISSDDDPFDFELSPSQQRENDLQTLIDSKTMESLGADPTNDQIHQARVQAVLDLSQELRTEYVLSLIHI